MLCSIKDIKAVDRVLKHPDVYNCISDDISPPIDAFSVKNLINNGVPVIMPNLDTVFIFIPKNGITYEIHITTTPEGRGNKAIEAATMALDFAFLELANCKKLICNIPVIYKNVEKFAYKMGFKKEGELSESYQKNNKLYNESIYGLRRSEWLQRQQSVVLH